MRRIVSPCSFLLVVLLILLSIGAPRIHADNALNITSQTTENKFRQSVTFNAKVTSKAGNVIAARLLTRDRVGTQTTLHIAEKFDPAPSVDVHYVWDTRTDVTPPFQILRYSWEFVDDAGDNLQTPFVEFEMADDTHPWKSLSDGKVRVYWYGNTDDYGKALLQAAQRGFAHVSQATGYVPDGELRVVMYPDQPSFMSFFPSVERVSSEWIGGETFGTMTVQWDEASVKNDGGEYSLMQVVPHELAHAFLDYRMAGRSHVVPSWFNEGQAVNNQIEGVDSALANARKMAHTGRLLHLFEMEGHSQAMSDFQDIVDWYDTATSLVAFLYDKYGLNVLGKIITNLNDGTRFDDALKASTGLTMIEYEKEWRAWLGAPKLPDAELNSTPTMEMPQFPPTPDYSRH